MPEKSKIENLYTAYLRGFRGDLLPADAPIEEETAATLGERDSGSTGPNGALLRNVMSVATTVRDLLSPPVETPPPNTLGNRRQRRAKGRAQ